MAGWFWSFLRGFSVLVSDLAVILLTVGLVPLLGGWGFLAHPALWAALLALQLAVGLFLISREVSWSVYLVAEAVLLAVQMYLVCRFLTCNVHRTDMQILLGSCAAGVSLHGAFVSYRPPAANTILGYVDTLIVLTAFWLYAAFASGAAVSGEAMTLSLAAFVLDLFTVGHQRVRGECARVIQGAGFGSRLALGGILLACVLLTAAVVGRGAGQVHSLVDLFLLAAGAVASLLYAILSAAGNVLAAVLLFFIRLLPDAPQVAQEPAAAQPGMEEAETAEYAASVIPGWLLLLVSGILLAACVLYGLYRLKRVKIHVPRLESGRTRVVKKSYFWQALLSGILALAGRIRFEWDYARNRNTPEGLFILAERCGAGIHLPRHANESPGAYVRRLARKAAPAETAAGGAAFAEGNSGAGAGNAGQEALEPAASLDGLAAFLDRYFYGDSAPELSAASAGNYARLLQSLAPRSET